MLALQLPLHICHGQSHGAVNRLRLLMADQMPPQRTELHAQVRFDAPLLLDSRENQDCSRLRVVNQSALQSVELMPQATFVDLREGQTGGS
jgi:hypothetical protein